VTESLLDVADNSKLLLACRGRSMYKPADESVEQDSEREAQ
jgi:hypothetical protein